MAKKVVVTGGASFIGSHVTEELEGRGYHVITLDDLALENILSQMNKLTKPAVSISKARALGYNNRARWNKG